MIFNHGWSAMTPGVYRAWIDHIVRRGNIVIYPRYQASLKTKPATMCSNAIAATKDALDRLKSESRHVRAQLDKVAVVGHSAGAQISAGMAARAAAAGLPPLKAVMCVQPGKSWGAKRGQIPLDDVATMPASTLLLAVVGDRDMIVKDIDAKRIINETVRVPAQNKNLVKMVSDDHGSPALIANHFCAAAPGAETSEDKSARMGSGASNVGPLRQLMRERMRQRFQQDASPQNQVNGDATGTGLPEAVPTTANGPNQSKNNYVAKQERAGKPLLNGGNMHGIDALDYYCTWKLFDALEDAAFYGKNRDYALGNTAKQRYMGKWSDGVPVKKLIVQIGPVKAY